MVLFKERIIHFVKKVGIQTKNNISHKVATKFASFQSQESNYWLCR